LCVFKWCERESVYDGVDANKGAPQTNAQSEITRREEKKDMKRNKEARRGAKAGAIKRSAEDVKTSEE